MSYNDKGVILHEIANPTGSFNLEDETDVYIRYKCTFGISYIPKRYSLHAIFRTCTKAGRKQPSRNVIKCSRR